MTQPLGPPAPPTAEKQYNAMKHRIIASIPQSLARTRHGILAIRKIGTRH